MPIYEYRCDRCGEQVEVLVRSNANVPHCPRCGAVLHKRLFSAAHVRHRREGPAGPSRGTTCCGREDRCESPPCSSGEACRRG